MSITSHAVQLFDGPESLADSVFEFLRDGLLAGDHVLLVITSPHWVRVRAKCAEGGIDVDAAEDAGWLSVHDASVVVAKFMERDQPTWSAFDATAGAWVRRLLANGLRLRVYGEAVDLLARTGDFSAALRVEEFWNQLGETLPFRLLCGYSSEHFGNPRDAQALRDVCLVHSHVHVDSHDVLGSFLLKTHGAC